MTTIVYRDGILAADSRTTSSRKAECVKCGDETEKVVLSDKLKIVADFEVRFKGEEVIATAGAGSVLNLNRAIRLIKEGEDLESLYKAVLKVYEKEKLSPFGLIIVTTKHVWEFHYVPDNSKVKLLCHEKTARIAIGSGETVARFCLDYLNFDAVDSVKAAFCVDDYTGGEFIATIDCTKPKNELFVKKIVVSKKEELRTYFAATVKKSRPSKKKRS